MSITYITGDATDPIGDGCRIIAHVCNDAGRWGAGFSGAVSRRWPEPERYYREQYRTVGLLLGGLQAIIVAEQLIVANMIAQHGTRSASNPRPIVYPMLEYGLKGVAHLARHNDASVHMPRIGAGLAGGRWEDIEPIIERTLCVAGVPVTVYDLPA